MREIIHVVATDFVAVSSVAAASKIRQQLTKIEATRFRYRIETADVIFYVNAKFKIMYDIKHIFLLFKSNDKAYLRLHHEYILSNKFNRKLFNQRNEFFIIQKRIDRLIYRLKLSF